MRKIHSNNPVFRNPRFANEVFGHAHHPKAWLTVGCRLRSSADAIFERENPIAERFWDELRRIGSRTHGDGSPIEDFDEEKFPAPNFDAAYMLIAFAIENFLKGLAIAKGIATFSGQELPKNLRTHDLQKLHALAGSKTPVSPQVLDSLTYMSEWRARYPLPNSIEKFWPMHDDTASS